MTALLDAGLIHIDILAERIAGLPRARVLPGYLQRAVGAMPTLRVGLSRDALTSSVYTTMVIAPWLIRRMTGSGGT